MTFRPAIRLATLSSHLIRPNTTPLARPFSSTFKLGSSASSLSPETMSQVKQLVDSTIKENNVVVFSKSYCPYCKRAKALLQGETDDIKILELDEIEDGSAIQQYLGQINNGFSTVPQIFIGQQFIGGNSDLQNIPKAELKKRIAGSA